MNKTILLGSTGITSQKISRWSFIIFGIFYLIIGIRRVSISGASFESGGNVIIGFCFVVYALIVFTETPFTPKLKLDEIRLEFKNNFFGKTIIIDWSDMKSIEFGKYEMKIIMTDGETTLSYKSNPETSVYMKSSIRQIAELKEIPVISG